MRIISEMSHKSCLLFTQNILKVLASLRDTSHAITRLERVVAGDVGVDSAERLAIEINQVRVWHLIDQQLKHWMNIEQSRCSLLFGD